MNKKKKSPTQMIIGIVLISISVIYFLLAYLLLWGILNYVVALIAFIIGLVMIVSGDNKSTRDTINERRAKAEKEAFAQADMEPKISIPIDEIRRFVMDIGVDKYYVTPVFRSQMFEQDIKNSIFKLSDIQDVSLSEDNKTLVESRGGTGGALVGGLLFGATGAIVGSSTKKVTTNVQVSSLQVKILTRNVEAPVINIEFLGGVVSKDSWIYQKGAKAAEQIYSTLQSYLATRNQNQESQKTRREDVGEELRQLKQLLDEGIISQEDFDQKKKQLLGL